jgi:hypothetical protein
LPHDTHPFLSRQMTNFNPSYVRPGSLKPLKRFLSLA